VLASLIVLPFLPGLVKQARSALEARPQATIAAAPLASVPAPPVSVRQSAPLALTVDAGPGSRPWPLWLMAAWIVAAAWQMMRLVRGVVSVRRLKGRAPAVPRDALPVRLSRRVQLLASAEVASPVAVGYLHPAIVVPPKLLERLEEGERQNVLLHEVAHLARYDDWLNLATQTLGALLILHPLAAIVMRQIEREREMACDDFVVSQTGSARSYARSLARLHDLRWSEGTRLLAPGLLGRHSSLGNRIESLLRRGREFSARPSLASLGISALLLALLLGAGGLIPGWIAVAQTVLPKSFYADLPKSFEVASIRPAKPGRGSRSHGSNGRLWATVPVSWLIKRAYQIMPQQLDGLPSWARSARYTIQAEAPPGMAKDFALLRNLPPEQRVQAHAALRQSWNDMLRSLLTDRFKLKVHRETKRLPVYELVVAKGGPKLKPTDAEPGSQSDKGWRGHLVEAGASMDFFASVLSQYEAQAELGRIVINRTGLTGRYDFTLTWTPLGSTMNGMSAGAERAGNEEPATGVVAAPGSSNSSGPSIFTALQQQLGLKLKAAKGPVEVLVVDHIEPPTPN
jgi:bla regulator protein blaR1